MQQVCKSFLVAKLVPPPLHQTQRNLKVSRACVEKRASAVSTMVVVAQTQVVKHADEEANDDEIFIG